MRLRSGYCVTFARDKFCPPAPAGVKIMENLKNISFFLFLSMPQDFLAV